MQKPCKNPTCNFRRRIGRRDLLALPLRRRPLAVRPLQRLSARPAAAVRPLQKRRARFAAAAVLLARRRTLSRVFRLAAAVVHPQRGGVSGPLLRTPLAGRGVPVLSGLLGRALLPPNGLGGRSGGAVDSPFRVPSGTFV